MAKNKKDWHVKVYMLEEYWVEAETKEEAVSIANTEGDPSKVTTLKTVAKVQKKP